MPRGKDQARSSDDKSCDTEGPDNEWKFRKPYRLHTKDDNFKALYEGSCHCGRVEYQLSREKPLNSKYCHCTTCQVIHGAPFQWASIFEKSDINFTNGHHDLAWYNTSEKTTERTLPTKVSCAYCGTLIMDEGRNMILLFPTLIKFKSEEEKARFRPSCHMFYPQRVVDIDDDLPRWEGLNDNSALISDTSSEAKKRKREDMEN